jgi:hypothetical protein
MGVARELCYSQAKKTNYPLNLVGMIDAKDAKKFVTSFKWILNLEYDLNLIIEPYL